MNLKPGSMLANKYRIVRTIGQGGMGVVLEAIHDELDQRVAVKLMAEHAAANAEWAARFTREARLAARIKSEHVVRVFDVGKLETGQPYMAMELLEGEDLNAVLSRGRLEVPVAVDYVLQACEALAEAHAMGIVHRDLKPANLFVTSRSDGSPCVKVLDFGISKVTGDIQGIAVTNTSAIVGSPLYMSPEQMKASKHVDQRTDIWSLGVILHELVTGKPPFDGETAPELCALVLTAPPSKLKDFLPMAPPSLEEVVERCLEKDASKRFADVGQLARALAPLAIGHAKLSVERIARILIAKGQKAAQGPAATERVAETERVAIQPAQPTDVGSDMGDTVASGPRVDAPQGPTMLSAGQARQQPPQPTQKLEAQRPLPEQKKTERLVPPSAATIAQGPIAQIESQPLPKTGTTAAAWGGADTGAGAGARSVDSPGKRGWLPFAIAGAGLLALGGLAIVVTVVNHKENITPVAAKPNPPPSPTPTPTPSPSPTVAAAAAGADAGDTIDIASLPKATSTAQTGRPTTTAVKPATSTKKPPTSDTSEFGGRK